MPIDKHHVYLVIRALVRARARAINDDPGAQKLDKRVAICERITTP